MKVYILTRKRLVALSLVLAVLCFGGIYRTVSNGETVPVSTTNRSIPIYCVDTEEKKVSISFDAAWGNEQTQSLLDTLEKYNVKSTFFLVGDWVRNYPDDVKAIAAAGHDVGNHSNTHPYMTQLDAAGITSELESCNKDIEELTGKKPTLFRPPYGDYDNKVVDTVNGSDMYCVQWDVDSLDWKNLSAEEMCSRVKNNLKCGSIVLLHNGAENTPEALPMIIECIQEMGYEIVPISELLLKGEYATDSTGKMIQKGNVSDTNTDSAKTTAASVTENVNTAPDNSQNNSSVPAQSSVPTASQPPQTAASDTSSIGKKL